MEKGREREERRANGSRRMSTAAITISNVLRVQSEQTVSAAAPARRARETRPGSTTNGIYSVNLVSLPQLHRLRNPSAIDIAIASTGPRHHLPFFPSVVFFPFSFGFPLPLVSHPTAAARHLRRAPLSATRPLPLGGRAPSSAPTQPPTTCPIESTRLLCAWIFVARAILPSLFTPAREPATAVPTPTHVHAPITRSRVYRVCQIFRRAHFIAAELLCSFRATV